jgi:hypothetical protein
VSVWEAVAVLEQAGVTTGPQFEELRRRTRADQVAPAEERHMIAFSRRFVAGCTCGHLSRSTVPLAALMYLQAHIDESDKQKEERSDASQ